MSGGRLVVLDRCGRPSKQFPLPSGMATLGSGGDCDIQVRLPTVLPRHATIAVHTNQSVVRNVSSGETLLNGVPVSVSALAHGDVISIGGRSLQWLYDRPQAVNIQSATQVPSLPAQHAPPSKRRVRRVRRGTIGAVPPQRDRDIELELEMRHRASMPANAGGKQVAIVQPQRRVTNEQSEAVSPSPQPRPRQSAKSAPTKASQWIESRRSQAPRTPLRQHVLRKAHSARKPRASKIQAPDTIDPTKQAAIMLMTGHTRTQLSLPATTSTSRSPSLVVKKPSPVAKPASASKAKRSTSASPNVSTKSTSGSPNVSTRSTRRTTAGQSFSVLEITDAESRNSSRANRNSTLKTSPFGSPLLPSPRKSALKDPSVKSVRKTESIKFDLSNLEARSRDDESEILLLTDSVANNTEQASSIDSEVTLRYSDTTAISPSPRRSIHSRTSKLLEQVGSPLTETISPRKSVPESPRSRKSLRGSLIVQKALEDNSNVVNDSSRYSRRASKTLTDQSFDATAESAFRTRTLSPRSPGQNMESYSIVDLVSDTNETAKSASVYGSVGSTRSSSIVFGTPRNSVSRKTRSTIDPNLLTSSTPYVGRTRASRSQSSPKVSLRNSPSVSPRQSATKRSQSLSTPENSQKHISINSTRISRASRTKSRLCDSDLQFVSMASDETANETAKTPIRSSRANLSQSSPNVTIRSPRNSRANKSSPGTPVTSNSISRTSPRNKQSNISKQSNVSRQSNISKQSIVSRKSNVSISGSPNKRKSSRKDITVNISLANSSVGDGTITPENNTSPEAVGTPVLSIKNLLDSSHSSFVSNKSPEKVTPRNQKRKTIGAIVPRSKKARTSLRSKSFNIALGKSFESMRQNSKSPKGSKSDTSLSQTDDEIVTPKSAVKLVQEAVKNKHSTAKKPQSKRSIIDTLNESDFVKQLFNSPVKRKLSQSMTEFSRKQLFENEDDATVRRPKRNTVALTGRTPNTSGMDETRQITPENFVSPLSTPSNSPNICGVRVFFRRDTPNNDLCNIKGVKRLLRTSRTGNSPNNDLSNIVAFKYLYAQPPRNRLSDVRVKELFAPSPNNDLRRVSGVKSLFQSEKKKPKSPKNDLSDVRGVRKLFNRKSVANDLRNVSGVKRTLRNNSPRNDLSDVRGVRRVFKQEKQRSEYSDMSGVEELFNESTSSRRDAEALFDQLVGKPTIKAVYSKSVIGKPKPAKRTRRHRSLRQSIDMIVNNVEQWLDEELRKRIHKDDSVRSKVSKELQKLATDTTEGGEPLRTSRVRDSTMQKSREIEGSKKSASQIYSVHTLPIKKRSIAEVERSGVADKSNKLPIKKRAIVHSTPVKGQRYNLTMNASELGRVSPIAAVDKTQNVETNRHEQMNESLTRETQTTTITAVQMEVVDETQKKLKSSTQKRNTRNAKRTDEVEQSPKLKGKRSTRTTKNDTTNVKIIPTRSTRARLNTDQAEKQNKTSPLPKTKTTRGKKVNASIEKEQTIEAPRTRRQRADTEIVLQITKGRQTKASAKPETESKPKRTRNAKQVTPKKSPAPKGKQAKTQQNKPSPKTRKAKTNIATPQKENSRRSKTEEVPNNTQKRRASLVITKKAPVMSPKPSTSRRNVKEKNSSIVKSPRATRRQKEVKVVTPKPVKATRAKVVVAKPSPKMNPAGKKRNASTAKVTPKELPVKSTRGRRNTNTEETVTSKTRGKSATEKVKVTPKKRGRAIENIADEEPKSKRSRKTTEKSPVDALPKRGRSTRGANVTAQDETAKPRATKVQGKNTTLTATKPGKKVAEVKNSSLQLGKRGTKVAESNTQTDTRRGRGTKQEEIVAPEARKGRKRKSQDEHDSVPAKLAKNYAKGTRGRQIAKVVEEEVKGTRGRGRRAQKNDEMETTKGKKVQSPKGKNQAAKVQTPKGKKVQTPQGKKVQTPKGKKEVTVQSPKGKNQAAKVQTPKGKKVLTPKGKKEVKVQTPKGKKQAAAKVVGDVEKKTTRGQKIANLTNELAKRKTQVAKAEGRAASSRSRRR